MQMRITRLLAPIFAALSMGSLPAADKTFHSGPGRVALIELYTSEGCSSCPPAEAWLGNLQNDPGLWKNFVPVAFHVTYWDRLGWKDILASKVFTEREYAYGSAWNSASVYTPCFVRNGVEWRPRDAAATADKKEAPAGALTLTWNAETHTCRVDFAPAENSSKKDLAASVALLGGGIVSDVRKGENAGHTLRHEFVALRLETIPLQSTGNGSYSGTIELPPRPDLKAERLALAGWTHPRNSQKPHQAAGGWIQD